MLRKLPALDASVRRMGGRRDLPANEAIHRRPSMREAMLGLTVFGLVRTRRGGGGYISDLSPDTLLGPIQFYLQLQQTNIKDLYDARRLIESDVVRRAAST